MRNRKLRSITSLFCAIVMVSFLIGTLAACSADSGDESSASSSVSVSQSASSVTSKTESASIDTSNEDTDTGIGSSTDVSKPSYDVDDTNTTANAANMTTIKLNKTTATVSGSGAKANGSTVTISSAGAYSISGTLNNGQIIVNSPADGTVHLILNGANITCSKSSPIYIKDSDKTVITLASGTKNIIKDGTSYVLDDAASGEPNAAIFSKDELTINGTGSLTVDANYDDGIASKDELKIMSGNIAVTAVDDGIRGKDYLAIKNANITITCKGDGLKSSNTTDTSLGFITIESGTIKITSDMDAIQAETSVEITGGNITVKAGGGSGYTVSNNTGLDNPQSSKSGSSVSTKGIKAGKEILISGGTLGISSADDGINSNNAVNISGGNIRIASGDDGVHSDTTLKINGGTINIIKSYEGLESAEITINKGTVHVASSDDGINVAGGNDQSSVKGRPGQNTFSSGSNLYLYLNGGYIYVDAVGDGIDVNGSITMTGGTVLVNGPTSDGNGALDYDGTFKVTGGFLVAAGSSGMALAPSTTSTQYSIMATFSSTQSAGTLVHVEDASGKNIVTFAPTKQYNNVVVCSSGLKKGESYNIYYGGKSSGTNKDGLYTGGSYSSGTKCTNVTLSSVVTTYGSTGGMNGGMNSGGDGRMR